MGEDRWKDEERRYWDQERHRMQGRDDDWRGARGGMSDDYGQRRQGGYGYEGERYRDGQQGYGASRDYQDENWRRDSQGDADYRRDSGWRAESHGQHRDRGYGQNSSYGGRYAQDSGTYGGGPAGGRYGVGGGADYGRSRRDAWQGRETSRHHGARHDDDRNWMDKAGDEVASWFGDDRASQRREIDKGHVGKGPQGYSRSDDRIREDINDRLTDDWFLDASQISVEVAGGEVTLSGTIQSRQDKRRAEDIAEDVSGVRHVQNNLRVAQTGQSQGQSQTSTSSAGGRSNTTTGSHVGSGSVGAGISSPTSSNGGASSRTQ